MKYIKEFLPYIIVIIIAFLIRTFLYSPIQVVGSSMVPNLNDKELMLLDKISYRFNDIKRFDIVVVKSEKPIIKRIIGLPEEEIEYRDNKLYVNGKFVDEKFKTNGKTSDFNIKVLGSTKVPKDSYFVVGDNRINSKDSRVIGFIKKDQIEGKAFFVLYPFNKFGNV